MYPLSFVGLDRCFGPLVLAIVGLIALATPLRLGAQEGPKAFSVTQSFTTKAPVEAIDRNTLVVTLRAPKGNTVAAQAVDSISGLSDVKVGDEVEATYSQSVAVTVRQPGEPEPKKEDASWHTGKTAASALTITLTVKEIDRPTQTVSIKGPEGRVVNFRLSNPKTIDSLNVGDSVDLSLTQARLLKIALVTH